jgi:glycosyltransferase involved in cell wall biosynthesis
MNILALNWNDLKNPFGGGAEVHFEELLRRLVKMGHKVTLVCSAWPGASEDEIVHGVRIRRVGSRQSFNFVVPSLLKKLTKAEQFDLLIEDINKIPFYTPCYLKLPTLVVIPHLFATTVFQEVSPALASYVYLAEMPMIPIYKRFLFNVISESTAEEIVARGVPKNQVSVIHCGIDRGTYSYDPSLQKFTEPTVLYLGRIKKYKSIQHLIAACALLRIEIPNIRLVIVGDGDYTPTLKKQVADLQLEQQVHFTGYVSKEVKVDYLRRSHAAVLPSIKEGWGLTNIEANAVGTVAIAANSPGLRDSVKDGHSGLLYPYGDIHSLAEKLKLVLTNDAERVRLESGAREWANRFDWDRAAERFAELLPQVVARGARP